MAWPGDRTPKGNGDVAKQPTSIHGQSMRGRGTERRKAMVTNGYHFDMYISGNGWPGDRTPKGNGDFPSLVARFTIAKTWPGDRTPKGNGDAICTEPTPIYRSCGRGTERRKAMVTSFSAL